MAKFGAKINICFESHVSIAFCLSLIAFCCFANICDLFSYALKSVNPSRPELIPVIVPLSSLFAF